MLIIALIIATGLVSYEVSMMLFFAYVGWHCMITYDKNKR